MEIFLKFKEIYKNASIERNSLYEYGEYNNVFAFQ